METKTNSNAMRLITGNRNSCQSRPENRMETSYGRPVHVSLYLNRIMDADGKCNKEKLHELFNIENYG